MKILPVLLLSAATLSACGAPPEADPAPTSPLPGPVLWTLENRVQPEVDPQWFEYYRNQLKKEGKGELADRLAKSYDPVTGKLVTGLRERAVATGVMAAAATWVGDSSFSYSCETLVTCSGSLWWRSCTVPWFGCGQQFLNGESAGGGANSPLRAITIHDRNVPPPGPVPPPRIFYSFFQNNTMRGEFEALGQIPFSIWNNGVEALKVRLVGDSRWNVSYTLISNQFRDNPRIGMNGELAGVPRSGHFIQRFWITIFRVE